MAKFTRELDELVANEIITPDVAERIRGYYNRPSQGSNRLVIAFSIIGALLVGMGFVLIIAHNWDELSDSAKLFTGMAPMFICHAIAGVLIFKGVTNKAWTEAVATAMVFAIATAIAIVSQVYNISGDFPKFLLTWCILTLPIIYVLRSWMASLLYWCGSLWYAWEVGFTIFSASHSPRYFWLLALAGLPFYIQLIRKSPNANSIAFHTWIISIAIALVTGFEMERFNASIIAATFVTLFSIYILVGQLPYFAGRKLISNAWLIGGSAGTILTLLILTFEWPSIENTGGSILSMPLFVWLGLFIVASGLLYIVGDRIGYRNVLSKSYTFIVYVVLFFIGLSSPLISIVLTNVLLLALGIYTIREGAMANQLWKMNYGLLILSILIGCRFFDTDLSFVLRGLLFVAIGAGFFGMNIYMVRKRKATA